MIYELYHNPDFNSIAPTFRLVGSYKTPVDTIVGMVADVESRSIQYFPPDQFYAYVVYWREGFQEHRPHGEAFYLQHAKDFRGHIGELARTIESYIKELAVQIAEHNSDPDNEPMFLSRKRVVQKLDNKTTGFENVEAFDLLLNEGRINENPTYGFIGLRTQESQESEGAEQ